MEKKIVILGGGFAGVKTAQELVKRKKESTKITLVNRTSYHEFHGDLYELAATNLVEKGSKAQKRALFGELAGTVAVPLEEIFKNKDIEIKTGEIEALDLKEKFVKLENKDEIGFDILVIALGSVTNFFDIDQLENQSLPLKNVNDALNIRNEIDELFLSKNPNEEIKIVVGGGGFTGCELSGELANYVKDLAKIHQKHPGKTKITIIEACPTLLNGSNNWFQQKALERLKKLNVEVLLNSKITSVSDKKVILEDNSEVDFDVLIWTAGVKANPLVSKIDGVSLAKNQCFAVDKYLRILGFENVFALGDNTYCFSSEKACIVPPTAQAAIEQGKITGKNIVRLLENKPLFEYSAKLPSFVVPLGEGFALAEIWGMKVSGILGWWLKRLITLRYLSSILPFSTAVKLWYQGVKFFI